MTARILVVDDILPNIKLLEAKLSAEYFEVLTAMNGLEALEVAEKEIPDIILLDVMMPGMDGFEVCRRIKGNPKLMHIPVVMVTALDQQSDKVTGLKAGADDFLTKPVDDISLFARIRSLVRVKMMIDELRLRQKVGEHLGVNPQNPLTDEQVQSKVMIIEDVPTMANKMASFLPGHCSAVIENNAIHAFERLRNEDFNLVIISLSLSNFDALRLCSMIRSVEQLRRVSLLVVVEEAEKQLLVRALDIGVNDYIRRPVDTSEFIARVRTQLKRHFYAEQLRQNMENSVEYAVTDPLTGLFNRRYLNMHLLNLIEMSLKSEKNLAVCILDIDFFKKINDTYGHDVGDEVLKEFSKRLMDNARNVDLVVRLGGEEFVIVMPETEIAHAAVGAERIRSKIAEAPFTISGGAGRIPVTASIGIAGLVSLDDNPDTLLKRADAALYRAKSTGRNRVILHRGKPASGNGGQAPKPQRDVA